ncbi:hypothetical protein L0222_18405 [bacterium]|nr:hypothetical protein [bacterium]MCI0604854.1 hypothetical protein [bacterium]
MSYPDALYLGDEGEVSAKYRPMVHEPDLAIGTRASVRYLATGPSTNGQFGLYRWDILSRGQLLHLFQVPVSLSEIAFREPVEDSKNEAPLSYRTPRSGSTGT